MSVEAVSGITASLPGLAEVGQAYSPDKAGYGNDISFSALLMDGLHAVESKIDAADSIVQQFVLDDSTPVHQVAIALEQAQLSVELAMQVRARLLESFRDVMNMQV